MRVSTMIRISAAASLDSRLIDRITDFARQVEAKGFPGIWIGVGIKPLVAHRLSRNV